MNANDIAANTNQVGKEALQQVTLKPMLLQDQDATLTAETYVIDAQQATPKEFIRHVRTCSELFEITWCQHVVKMLEDGTSPADALAYRLQQQKHRSMLGVTWLNHLTSGVKVLVWVDLRESEREVGGSTHLVIDDWGMAYDLANAQERSAARQPWDNDLANGLAAIMLQIFNITQHRVLVYNENNDHSYLAPNDEVMVRALSKVGATLSTPTSFIAWIDQAECMEQLSLRPMEELTPIQGTQGVMMKNPLQAAQEELAMSPLEQDALKAQEEKKVCVSGLEAPMAFAIDEPQDLAFGVFDQVIQHGFNCEPASLESYTAMYDQLAKGMDVCVHYLESGPSQLSDKENYIQAFKGRELLTPVTGRQYRPYMTVVKYRDHINNITVMVWMKFKVNILGHAVVTEFSISAQSQRPDMVQRVKDQYPLLGQHLAYAAAVSMRRLMSAKRVKAITLVFIDAVSFREQGPQPGAVVLAALCNLPGRKQVNRRGQDVVCTDAHLAIYIDTWTRRVDTDNTAQAQEQVAVSQVNEPNQGPQLEGCNCFWYYTDNTGAGPLGMLPMITNQLESRVVYGDSNHPADSDPAAAFLKLFGTGGMLGEKEEQASMRPIVAVMRVHDQTNDMDVAVWINLVPQVDSNSLYIADFRMFYPQGVSGEPALQAQHLAYCLAHTVAAWLSYHGRTSEKVFYFVSSLHSSTRTGPAASVLVRAIALLQAPVTDMSGNLHEYEFTLDNLRDYLKDHRTRGALKIDSGNVIASLSKQAQDAVDQVNQAVDKFLQDYAPPPFETCDVAFKGELTLSDGDLASVIKANPIKVMEQLLQHFKACATPTDTALEEATKTIAHVRDRVSAIQQEVEQKMPTTEPAQPVTGRHFVDMDVQFMYPHNPRLTPEGREPGGIFNNDIQPVYPDNIAVDHEPANSVQHELDLGTPPSSNAACSSPIPAQALQDSTQLYASQPHGANIAAPITFHAGIDPEIMVMTSSKGDVTIYWDVIERMAQSYIDAGCPSGQFTSPMVAWMMMLVKQELTKSSSAE